MPVPAQQSVRRSQRLWRAGTFGPFARRLAPLAIASALAQSACFVGREAGDHMQAELRALRGELTQTTEQLAAQRAALGEQKSEEAQALANLRSSLEALAQSARRADADFAGQLDQVVSDLQHLRGAVEDNEHRLTETEARLQAELATRLAALKQAAAAAPKDDRDASSAAAKSAAPRNKAALVGYARKLLKDGKKADARGVLRDVVRRYGTEAGLGDQALYLLASLAYDDGQMAAALRDWVRLVDAFPKSKSSAEAYFKIGACSAALNHPEDAKTFFQEVVSTYAKSPWAAQAKQRLALLGKVPATGGPGRGAPASATKGGTSVGRQARDLPPTASPPVAPAASVPLPSGNPHADTSQSKPAD